SLQYSNLALVCALQLSGLRPPVPRRPSSQFLFPSQLFDSLLWSNTSRLRQPRPLQMPPGVGESLSPVIRWCAAVRFTPTRNPRSALLCWRLKKKQVGM
ncbi:hypothetical protein D4764_19G0005750, partial [Takifugu flavidus]